MTASDLDYATSAERHWVPALEVRTTAEQTNPSMSTCGSDRSTCSGRFFGLVLTNSLADRDCRARHMNEDVTRCEARLQVARIGLGFS